MEDTLQPGTPVGTHEGELQRGASDTLVGARERAKRLKLMIFDVDGVMTDGTLYYSERGEELKAFNVQDGHGIKMLKQYGVEVALITARSSRAVELRAASLGIAHVHQGVQDKRGAYAALLTQLRLAAEQSGYMGDDLVDLPLIARCGFAATVPASPATVRSRCHYVARASGGHGAVREVCEFILDAQGALVRAIEAHLQ